MKYPQFQIAHYDPKFTIDIARVIALSWLTPDERRIFNELRIGKHISNSVRINRLARGLTQWQLAGKAGVSWATIQTIERWYNVNYTMGTLLKIAKALDIAVVAKFVSWLDLLASELCEKAIPTPSFSSDRLTASS